jgi:protoporphyrinogen oxidase
VAVIDYERVMRNIREGRDDLAWGPNNKFVFPARGGTGEIYRRLAGRLGERVRYGREVVEIDHAGRSLRTGDGEWIEYDALITTMPLDRLIGVVTDCPDALRDAAGELRHNGVYMVGVGYEAPLADSKSWMYFPDPDVPFYRATNFAKYSPANVPDSATDRYCAYMTETAYSDQRPVARAGLEERVEAALRSSGVIAGRPSVASVHVEDIPYAYPVPTRGRDAALRLIQPWLMERGIYSRGRFGAWRYEAGNMDHAVKMGIDAARRVLGQGEEELWALG